MSVIDVKNRYELMLLQIPGVVAVAADKRYNQIVVYVESVDVCKRIPAMLEGYTVRCEVVGKLISF